MNQIKLFDPVVSDEEELSIKKIFKSGFWASGAGIGKVSDFEQKFRKYVDSKDCIGVNSGTAALQTCAFRVGYQKQGSYLAFTFFCKHCSRNCI